MSIKRAFFKNSQKNILSKSYEKSPYPIATEMEELATSMNKPVKHIKNWFKNERARKSKSINKNKKDWSIKILKIQEKEREIPISPALAIKSEPILEVSRTNSNDSTYIPSEQSSDSDPGELQIVTDEEIDVSGISDPGQLQILDNKEIDVSSISEYSGTGKVASTPLAVKDTSIADDTFSK